jgi:hypothetical protein
MGDSAEKWGYNHTARAFVFCDQNGHPDVTHMVKFYDKCGLLTETQLTRVLPENMSEEDKQRMLDIRAVLANAIQLANSLSPNPIYTPKGAVICKADFNKHLKTMTPDNAKRYLVDWERCTAVEKMQYDASEQYIDKLWKQCVLTANHSLNK